MSEFLVDRQTDAVAPAESVPHIYEPSRWDRMVDVLVSGRKKWVALAAGAACIATACTEYQTGLGGAGILAAGSILVVPAGLANGVRWGERVFNNEVRAQQAIGESVVQLAFETT